MRNKVKVAFRKQQLEKIHHFLGQPETSATLQHLYQQLFEDSDFLKANVIGVTLSMAEEIPTQPIITFAQAHQKQVVVPRTLPKRQMAFVVLDETTRLERTKFGTQEPVGGTVVAKSEIDALIVPGLAFSRDHYRLGFGGGYYDRFLADFEGMSIAVATPPQFFEKAAWPIEDFDMKVKKIIH
ncbi:5-formyltetrahydrofolate cyclo-ligase [Lentilactobacillus farraginis]|uniref:5-formyltetrahydrofolate cyclo-ligase n=1 Tax=Lentilactobacillus farraginis DSM 18382 = JCM 14108 TaxID=1423743 RepID=X0PGE3_9LACO|nr:5-formyltetrahydrofolate cyclo-ligase [Lentilactobacillus farraginis]KRM04332.1 5-formyltetrahydrofolate cyclo-ligase [Lentilactobacillus farraginis DSM 18382 = JCM 14108]GAF36012.1 5-formyltetrahydrofolate cyclo-ligase [Lentilactobacillus farraginis DSM 18382 = JCM 14108]